jgi:hypothetical protein
MRFVSFAAVSATAIILAACGETTESLTLNSGLDVCGLSCPVEVAQPVSVNGNLPATAPTNNKGNKTDIPKADGDTTIALEKSIIINEKTKLSQSTLTRAGVGDERTAILEIDTNTNRNSLWPKPKVMEYYAFGTNADTDTLGGEYTEYRILSSSIQDGTNIDEELQVWAWGNSYATQYRDVTSGAPDADHQAWSFGGKRTALAAMPTGGTATMTGRFGATAKTANWLNTKDQRQKLDYNNNWQVNGSSEVVADFGSNKVTGRLRPEKFRAIATMNGATGRETITVDRANYTDAIFANPATHPHDKIDFIYQDIVLQGTITKDTVKGNSVAGKALFGPTNGYISNSTKNPFAGAFFGPNANEFTGIFNVEATLPDPVGGEFPINADTRATVQMSGTLHAE